MKEVKTMIREEAVDLLLAMADSAREIADFLKEQPSAAEEQPLTLEQVRAELSPFSKAGKTSVVKEILGKFGANKLSDVDPKDYWALMAMAQEARGCLPEADNA